MEYFVICLAAFAVACATLVSGFGLGTVLMPVFALFFPLPAAVAATAVVHLSNNLFKVALVGRDARREAVLRFGLPAVFAALAGAALLGLFSGLAPLAAYELAGRRCEVTLLKLIIATIILFCALWELVPGWSSIALDRKYLGWGGAASGFLGGLSGNQGALRSAFLLKAGLTKEEFIGTGAVTSAMVDTARLLVYGVGFYSAKLEGLNGELGWLVLAATLAAFAGSVLSARWIKKITYRTVQWVVGSLLIALSLAMGAGLV
jgi:hypothetical protein